MTLSKNITKNFFVSENGFQELKSRWASNKERNAPQHLLYTMLRGKSIEKAFSVPCNTRKVTNGAKRGWIVARLLLELASPVSGPWEKALKEFEDLLLPTIKKDLFIAYFGVTYGTKNCQDWLQNIEPQSPEPKYTFVMVNSELPMVQKIIQAAHATWLAGKDKRGPAPHIVLGEGNPAELAQWIQKFETEQVKATTFKDFSMLTAFCTDPIPSEKREPYTDFPLMR